MMIYIESPYSLICYTLHQFLKTISDTPLNLCGEFGTQQNQLICPPPPRTEDPTHDTCSHPQQGRLPPQGQPGTHSAVSQQL